MCTYKRYIRTAIGKEILVKCGHCAACLQEKAIARANRCRNEYPSDGSRVALFVTLTYRNACVPYVDMDEVYSTPTYYERLQAQGKELPVDMSDFRSVKVYRNAETFWCRVGSGYDFKRKTVYKRKLLTTICFQESLLKISNLQYLRGQQHHRVGVCYLPDVQNFIKRLRINLTRKYGYDKSFSFYQCSEYGPTTCRPHFHLLIYVPFDDVTFFKKAISEAWSYDNYVRTFKNIEVARNAASYVASYVNCAASVPPVLSCTLSEVRPKCSYSQGFGVAKECFSLPKVLEAFERADLHYDCARFKQQSLVVDRVLLPTYVISRYFPKIKGYSCLTTDEVERISLHPELLCEYSEKLGYNNEDLYRNFVRLSNKQFEFCRDGRSVYDFARVYSRIWSLYSSNIITDFYSGINALGFTSNFTAYDNIKDFYDGSVRSDTLDDVFVQCPGDMICYVDYNQFPENVSKTNNLMRWYDSYSKDKKVRNLALASNHFNI